MMKRVILLLACIAVFFSCKSLPKPGNDTDSLVIGGFTWEFPDGFFELAPKTLTNDITLGMVNLSNGKRFSIRVSNGYFTFLAHGNDQYMLQYAKYKSPGGPKIYTLGYNLNLQINSKPKRIIYVGHIRLLFSRPEKVEAKGKDAAIYTSWYFRKRLVIENKIAELQKYLTKNARNTSWRNYTVENLYEK